MRSERQVLVQLDGVSVPGLLLKWRRSGEEALVTYEVDGRVETAWVPVGRVEPMTDPPRSPDPVV